MGSDQNKAIVRRFIEKGFNEGNLAAVDDLLASDYVIHVAGNEVGGREGMKQFISSYRAALPDYACTIDEQMADGDKVITRWTARGTQQGELMGIPPTGKQITISGIVIDHIANGKLVESWLQGDFLGMMQQLGVVPSPERTA